MKDYETPGPQERIYFHGVDVLTQHTFGAPPVFALVVRATGPHQFRLMTKHNMTSISNAEAAKILRDHALLLDAGTQAEQVLSAIQRGDALGGGAP